MRGILRHLMNNHTLDQLWQTASDMVKRYSSSDLESFDIRLKEHLGTDPSKLPIFEQTFSAYERPNLHLAIEEILAAVDSEAVLLGVIFPYDYESMSLAKLAHRYSGYQFKVGPVEYVDVSLADDNRLSCVRRGVFLLRDKSGVAAALLVHDEKYTAQPGVVVEVMSGDRDVAQDLLRRLSIATRYGKAFRGHVLSVTADCYGRISVGFHKLPHVSRDAMILPASVMMTLERLTIGFTAHASRLRKAGRHLKRGILLHGAPGTGKTLSAMYLASQMKERTVLVLTGQGIGTIEVACKLARSLDPSTVILEDVDLVALERTQQTVSANALLFELLNQMDGLAEDADILFILTTNRPDILEPALAARPGRIDQAIYIPVPDEECRRRLFDLYSRGLNIPGPTVDRFIRRTDGASGAFVREFLRKAALIAAEANESEPIQVEEDHLELALSELVLAGGQLTQSLLGADIRGIE